MSEQTKVVPAAWKFVGEARNDGGDFLGSLYMAKEGCFHVVDRNFGRVQSISPPICRSRLTLIGADRASTSQVVRQFQVGGEK